MNEKQLLIIEKMRNHIDHIYDKWAFQRYVSKIDILHLNDLLDTLERSE